MTAQEESYREIELSKGMRAKVSVCDYSRLSVFNWHAAQTRRDGPFYARRSWREGDKTYHESMHRVILGLTPGDGVWGDHRNGDTLDYRRSNLRVATPSQNNMNRRTGPANTSGLKGVGWHSIAAKWRARIKLNRQEIHLGLFHTPEEAHAAYCEAAKEHHGEFARTR